MARRRCVCETADILYLPDLSARSDGRMALRPKILGWGPYEDFRGWLRGLAITLVAASFLAFAGAFSSSRAALPVRFGYWLGLMVVGWLWGGFVSRAVFNRVGGPGALWLRIAISSLALAVPYSVVVGVTTHLVLRSNFDDPLQIADLLVSVIVVTTVMVTINVLVARRTEGLTEASSAPAKFLDRLPPKLRGADVWAVEAEDHYLRLHTSRGQDLILMRLSDAVAELEGIEGAQVHRSWWVSRGAIAHAVRGDGRATLTLTDGAEVPVSRPYARLLRERGWI
ncbi:MAG TPA: LytTR family DNA-binding domain-containing protein [Phenylobacterium sp.]|jgi:DNA-binding LytR/AlgR family response regulator|uniref:LytTR family DNA-binding domain-containing protein n=1 Tax=Phenylobacterium sp. TaxID=1871053 RepID=UPI002CD8AB9D|nr:LytTR family DNA-binding domain-containing protein [Phenylobacterium sp.]HXA40888.1 LytTR family DNA-binding domain-containing protein [Phenylobacterium sp.]